MIPVRNQGCQSGEALRSKWTNSVTDSISGGFHHCLDLSANFLPCLTSPDIPLSLASVSIGYHLKVNNMQWYCSVSKFLLNNGGEVKVQWDLREWEGLDWWYPSSLRALTTSNLDSWITMESLSHSHLMLNHLSISYQPSFHILLQITLRSHCEHFRNSQCHPLQIHSSKLPYICGEINHSHHRHQFTGGDH